MLSFITKVSDYMHATLLIETPQIKYHQDYYLTFPNNCWMHKRRKYIKPQGTSVNAVRNMCQH